MVALRGLTKRFGDAVAVDAIDLDVYADELVTLLGPSGCGKTTTLRCVTGSLEIDAGSIRIGGVDVTRVPTHRRQVGLVFQNFALFPHMTVGENVAFPLKVRRVPAKEIRDRVGEALMLVRLGHVADRYPRELSGGQQQRVGLARAIVYRPPLVLFDEPLSNLDAKLRREMRYEIRRLRDELGFAAIYVTHDQEEALALSDRIAVMNDGVIHQIGEPAEIYANPRTLFVAEFLGNPNRIAGTLVARRAAGAVVQVGTTEVETRAPVDAIRPGEEVVLVIRPEAVAVARSGGASGANRWEARVVALSFLGERQECRLAVDGGFVVHAYLPPTRRHALGDVVAIEVPAGECRVFRT
ncbi:MAG TPA: ABC transporter ATP-binding protein [Gaiellaceae bacterium]|nr:ABC transporter ATP-binding protein [Gaiellaceae bacterium]